MEGSQKFTKHSPKFNSKHCLSESLKLTPIYRKLIDEPAWGGLLELQNKKLLSFFQEQIILEKKIVELAEANANATNNVLIAELIRGIALDSRKHANLLNAATAMASGPTPLIEEQQMEALGDHIKEHIKLEEEAIKTYKEQLITVKDERMQLILQYLLSDEQRHHALLTRIDKWIIQPQTLTEDDLWEMFWKHAPFHGSPGG